MAGAWMLGSGQAMKEIGILVFVCGAGAAFGVGFSIACKLLKWAPVNVTLNIHNPPGTTSAVSSEQRSPGEAK